MGDQKAQKIVYVVVEWPKINKFHMLFTTKLANECLSGLYNKILYILLAQGAINLQAINIDGGNKTT